MVKIEYDPKLDPELLELLEETETVLAKEIYNGKVLLYAESYDLDEIPRDLKKLQQRREHIAKIYKTVALPSEAIEIIRSEGHEHHNSRSGPTYWAGN